MTRKTDSGFFFNIPTEMSAKIARLLISLCGLIVSLS